MLSLLSRFVLCRFLFCFFSLLSRARSYGPKKKEGREKKEKGERRETDERRRDRDRREKIEEKEELRDRIQCSKTQEKTN